MTIITPIGETMNTTTSPLSLRIETMRSLVYQLFSSSASNTETPSKITTRSRGQQRSSSSTHAINTGRRRSSLSTIASGAAEEHTIHNKTSGHGRRRRSSVTTTTTSTSSITSSSSVQRTIASLLSSSTRSSLFLGFLGMALLVTPSLKSLQYEGEEEKDDSLFSEAFYSMSSDQHHQNQQHPLSTLFARGTGVSLILFTVLSLFLASSTVAQKRRYRHHHHHRPSLLLLMSTSKVTLLYGLAVWAMGHALLSASSSSSPSHDHHRLLWLGGGGLVCWMLAGWEAYAWKEQRQPQKQKQQKVQQQSTTCTATAVSSSPEDAIQQQQQQQRQELQSMARDVSRVSLMATLPLLVALLGLPNTVARTVLAGAWSSSNNYNEHDHDLLLQQQEELVAWMRLFGICQLAYVVLLLDWNDYYQTSSSSPPMSLQFRRAKKTSMSAWMVPLILPLVQLGLINLPVLVLLVPTVAATMASTTTSSTSTVISVVQLLASLFALLAIGQLAATVWVTVRIGWTTIVLLATTTTDNDGDGDSDSGYNCGKKDKDVA
jgi:hypothetical protein